MEEIEAWPEQKRQDELAYMATTIKSSWEFVDLVFLIEGVTRATAQQITRTRNASYAMQSQRVTDARSMDVANPFGDGIHAAAFDRIVGAALFGYGELVDSGAKLEDARGVLPMNTTCNLVAKYNLRALSDVIKARKSLRAQGEYNDIALKMESLAVERWPWVAPFFVSDHQVAIDTLETVAKQLGIIVGSGPGWSIAKAIDLLRKE